jgi:hypothetical protein
MLAFPLDRSHFIDRVRGMKIAHLGPSRAPIIATPHTPDVVYPATDVDRWITATAGFGRAKTNAPGFLYIGAGAPALQVRPPYKIGLTGGDAGGFDCRALRGP